MESVPSAPALASACPMSEPRVAPEWVIELERQYRFQWEPAQQAFVLLFPEGMVKLTPSAGEIVKRIDGKRTVADIIGDLEQTFPGVDLRQDVLNFLEGAYDRGYIRSKQNQ